MKRDGTGQDPRLGRSVFHDGFDIFFFSTQNAPAPILMGPGPRLVNCIDKSMNFFSVIFS